MVDTVDKVTVQTNTAQQELPAEYAHVYDRLQEYFREKKFEELERLFRDYTNELLQDNPRLAELFLFRCLQRLTRESMRIGETPERFESYLPAVVALLQSDCPKCIDEIIRLTEQILKHNMARRTGESNHLLSMAKDYVSEHLADENLNLERVSDHVGLSRVYFCKLFHQLEGVSFNSYLKRLRIERAKQLLMTTNMKVYEVSNAVGFSHAKYFGTVFKECVGETPMEFQRSAHK